MIRALIVAAAILVASPAFAEVHSHHHQRSNSGVGIGAGIALGLLGGLAVGSIYSNRNLEPECWDELVGYRNGREVYEVVCH